MLTGFPENAELWASLQRQSRINPLVGAHYAAMRNQFWQNPQEREACLLRLVEDLAVANSQLVDQLTQALARLPPPPLVLATPGTVANFDGARVPQQLENDK